MTEPTPGPWEACGDDRGGCTCGQIWGDDRVVAIATSVDSLEFTAMHNLDACVPSLDEMKANARLLGAAREMLAALQHAATALAYANHCAIKELKGEDDSIYQDPLNKVRAAVAKTRGES